jgi:hypothetical protein
MSGKIFTLDNDGKLTELSQKRYKDEDFFQSLIEKHPEILAGDQINPDNPRDWILISREMGVPAEQGGGAQWYLDHLFIDQDAIPTFVEVKRSTDTRIRREVVAQMLDYAANAVQYWSIDNIRTAYEKNLQEGTSLSNIGIIPEDEESFWKAVNSNLHLGKLRLIFAADEIPSSLQTIIEFLNNQMANTEVLGLEIKQFRSADGILTLVPRLIGRTSSAVQIKRDSRKWNEDDFIAQIFQTSGADEAELCKKILRAFESLDCYVWWGQGKVYGSFVMEYRGDKKHHLFSVYNGGKRTKVQIYFQNFKPPFDAIEYKQKMKSALEKIPNVRISNDRLSKYPSFNIFRINDEEHFNHFVEIMKSHVAAIKNYESTQ